MLTRVLKYFPATIAIDELDLTIHVTRLAIGEMTAFERDYKRICDPPSNRLIFVRRDVPDEQARDEKENFTIDLAAIGERRLKEMSDAERQRYDQLDDQDEAFAKQVLIDTVTRYVAVPEGQLEEDDGSPVTTGRQLLQLYGGRRDVLQQLLLAVYAENTLSDAQKKAQRSLFNLTRSLTKRVPAAAGPRPAPAVGAAESAASVESGAATASPSETPSGSGDEPIVH